MNSSLVQQSWNTFSPFSPLNTMKIFKKVVRMVHENQEWTCFLEERFPDNSEIKGIQNLKYYTEWLNSQGNVYFHEMSMIIQSYVNQIVAMSQVLKMKNTQENNCGLQTQNMQDTEEVRSHTKNYTQMLSDELKKEIDQKPWVKRLTRSDIQTKKGSYFAQKFNDKFLEVTGSMVKLKDDDDIISPWNCLLSPNWILFYMLVMKNRFNQYNFDFPRDC